MKNIWEPILDLLYPPRCVFCHNLTPKGIKVCDHCRKTLPWTVGPGQSRKLDFIPKCVSPLYYEGHVRDSLLRYKFRGLTAYAEIYGEFLSKCIDENEIFCDSITWVPLSRRRLRRRGYDQAGLLAEELARRSGLPCVRLLQKVRDVPAQSGIGNAAKRRANILGAYRASDGAEIRAMGFETVFAPVASWKGGLIRHDPPALASALMDLYYENADTRTAGT